MTIDGDDLWDGFVEPPLSARPRVWWHWMNGNIDREGIRLDLEWMKRIGVGGAQVFDGGMNAPQLVSERVVFGSPEWQESLRTAAQTADDLHLELTVATSAGWSAAGAPWVEPVDAMKKLVWSELQVEGGQVAVHLPALPSVSGLYQDVPRWKSPADPVFARDTFTVAIPAHFPRLLPAEATSSAGALDARALTDGLYATGIELPREPHSRSTHWISYRFDAPVSVGHVVLGVPSPRGFGSPAPVQATLEFSDDGYAWTPIVELSPSASPVRSRSFAPISATWFRMRFEGSALADALPPMDEGVLPLPFPPPAPFTVVSQFILFGGGRINAAQEKAGFSTTLDYYALFTDDGPGVDPTEVIDLTALVIDGILNWDAPAGSWRVIRFGYSLTGHQNGPAPAEATGLEVDKLDAARVETYLHRWLDQVRDAVGTDLIGERGVRSLLSDSIESGPQNWTESLPAEFERRRGYSLVPWMPVLAGYVVDSVAQSDRVLWDFRQTIAELYSDAFYSTVAKVAHEWGLDYYAEALEDHRPQLGDDLRMRSHADIPMGAMWTFSEADGPAPTYVADLRGASSVAHVYGKKFTGAESMSAFGHPYVYSPRTLKPVADLELALGVTRFCIHTSPHQPSKVRAPGISLTPHLGQTFTRNETWAEQAAPWIGYLARSSFLLNQGSPVADIAYFYGEEGPVTAVFGDREPDDVPPGFAWDFVSADALVSELTVAGDGALESTGGARYAVLYLGGSSSRMTLGVVRRIAELVGAGATVVGHPPIESPSAADDPAQFAAQVEQLWNSPRVFDNDLSEALGEPDWIAPGLDVVHRSLPDSEIYFIRNPASHPVELSGSFRAVADGAEWWDPVALTRTSAGATRSGGRTTVDLALPPFGTGFLVLGPDHAVTSLGPRQELATLVGLRTEQADDPGFSGTAVWAGELQVDSAWLRGDLLYLVLEDVHDLAEISVNGHSAGIAWTEPFEVEVTNLLDSGQNHVEIAVTNTWANRLIADAAHPESATTQLTGAVYSGDAPARPWGLRGSARLVRRGWTRVNSAY